MKTYSTNCLTFDNALVAMQQYCSEMIGGIKPFKNTVIEYNLEFFISVFVLVSGGAYLCRDSEQQQLSSTPHCRQVLGTQCSAAVGLLVSRDVFGH